MLFSNMKVNDIVTGVAQPKISQARLSKKEIIIPNIALVQKYHKAVESVFCMVFSIKKQIECLTESRDRLLPKLMSGEMEV